MVDCVAPWVIFVRGITNVSHTGGFPLFLSKPHFLETEPWVAKSVSGLHPSYNKHETYMDVEPMTGTSHEDRI